MGKIKVTNGREAFEIDGSDLYAAVRDGFKPTERVIVANSKTKESYEVDPQDVQHALNDGFSYQDVAKKQTQPVRQPPTQPSFQINLSEPTFKSAPSAIPNKQFDYNAEPPKATLSKLKGAAMQSADKLNKEIDTNRGALGKVVVGDRLKEQEKRRQAGIYGSQLEDKLFITDEDLNKINTEAKTDRNRANEVLTAAMKDSPEKEKEISKALYSVDAFNSAANDPNGEERAQKINENIKAIEKGELVYDHNKQLLVKPQGFFGSLISGRNELNRLSDAYDATKKMEGNGNEAGIIMELNERLKNNNPDEPVKVPSGFLGQIGQGVGGMPIKGMVAGAVASAGTALLGNPEASASAFHLASAGVNANDMYKIGYQNALEQNYGRFKKEHPEMPDYEALKKSQELASKQAVADAASAAVMQYLGGKVGFGAAKQLSKGISVALSQLGDNLGKKAFEAVGIGGIGAGTQAIKNIMAQQAGLKVKSGEGVKDAFDSGVLITGAMAILGLANEYIKPSERNKLISGLGKAPENVVEEGLNRLQQTGTLTLEQSENVKNIIKVQKTIENSIPDNIPETDRLKIKQKIDQRDYLQKQLEKLDESFHPEIKENIKKLNEDIIEISKGSERGDLQKLVHKEINDGKVQGFAIDVLRHAGEGELKNYMKEISEQAHDSNSAATTLETFGENIVNKAKELFPASESKEIPKSVSVIQPGEIQHPETITIKPQETKNTIQAADGQEYANTPRMHKLINQGNEIRNTLPGIPEGHTRLWRGNRIGETGQNPSFTNSLEGIALPFQEQYGGDLSYIDVPTSELSQYENKIGTAQGSEFILPQKIAENAQTIRSNQGEISGTGNVNGQRPDAGSEDIQQPPIENPIDGETEQQAGARTEESKATGDEKEIKPELTIDDAYGLPFIDEPGDKKTGIKNIISKTTRFERKLPEVQVDKLGSDQEVLQQGKELVDSGKINPLDVVNRILDTKEGMQPDEAKAMQYYMHQLSQHEINLRERLANTNEPIEHAEITGQLQQLSDEVDAATQANIISGKAWSDVGNIRQIVADTGFNASRDLATIKEAYGGKIPKDVQAKIDLALKERDEALNKLVKLQAAEKQKTADEAIKKEGAPKNTKKTKEDFKSERTEIKKSISDKLKKGRTGEGGLTAVPLPFAKELIAITPEIFKLIKSYAEEGIQKTEEVINRLHDALKDEIDGVTKADIVNLLAGRYKEDTENVSKISQRIRDFRTEANIWTKIAEATKMEEDTPVKKQEKNKKLQDLRDRLNDIRKRNNEVIAETKDLLTTDAQKELKKLGRQRKALETRYKTKKYLVPAEKTSSPITNEIIKEKQRIVNANYKIRVEKRKAFESQKNMYQKTLMWIGRGVRLSVLSGYNVLGKLAAAATIGGAGRRIPEQAIGFIYSNAFRGIAERAPIEGFVNAAAEAKFYKEFFNPKTFVKNSLEILKSGESPLSKKFSPGTYEHIPGIYLPTDLHQIIKDPLKRAAYQASLKNALSWAERNGMDINDDLVIQSLETAAYKRAQYEIFQEQNWLSKKFGEWKHKMEESGNLGSTGKFLADFMIPVSTVPTNIARRMVSTSPFGLIRGSVKVVEAYRKGIENLSPVEADSVMRQLKQGTLGTALWLIGWYGYSQFGGLYSKFNPNKSRDQGDLVSDEMSVGGKMVPKPVQHALPLEIIQFAATARRVYDNYNDNKGASTPESIEKAGLASIGALTEQIPIVETAAHTIGAFNNPYEAKKLEEDVRRRFEPQILRETGLIGEKKKDDKGATESSTTHERPTKTHRTNPHKR